MFAPQPIQIRYDDVGALGRAASGVGGGNANQFALQQLQARNQFSLAQGDQDLEANKLQMANQQMMDRYQGSTPTSSTLSNSPNSPLAQAIASEKGLADTSILSGVDMSPDEQSQFAAARANPNIPSSTYTQMATQFRNSKMAAAGTASDAASKQALVQNYSDQIDPADADSLGQLANDPKFSAQQLQQAVQKSAQKKRLRETVGADQAAKATEFASLPPDVQQNFAAYKDDPKITAQQFHVAATQARQQSQMQTQQKYKEQAQFMQKDVNTSQKAADKYAQEQSNGNGIGINFVDDPNANPVLNPKRQQIYQTWLNLKKQADAKQQKLDAYQKVTVGEAAGPDAMSTPTQPGQLTQLPPGQNQPIQVNDLQDAMALPSGSMFLFPGETQPRLRH